MTDEVSIKQVIWNRDH